jgi:hypothetical protein
MNKVSSLLYVDPQTSSWSTNLHLHIAYIPTSSMSHNSLKKWRSSLFQSHCKLDEQSVILAVRWSINIILKYKSPGSFTQLPVDWRPCDTLGFKCSDHVLLVLVTVTLIEESERIARVERPLHYPIVLSNLNLQQINTPCQ